jgi:hypothetical protein
MIVMPNHVSYCFNVNNIAEIYLYIIHKVVTDICITYLVCPQAAAHGQVVNFYLLAL